MWTRFSSLLRSFLTFSPNTGDVMRSGEDTQLGGGVDGWLIAPLLSFLPASLLFVLASAASFKRFNSRVVL